MPTMVQRGMPVQPASSPYTPFLTGVSSDGRYTVDQRGAPFLINADSAWNLAWGLSSTDQTTYLSNRQANGFNAVITDLVGNSNMHGNTNGANWNGEVPFTGGNFSTPNSTYWARIDTFFQLAAQYGISVFAIPIDAYATEASFGIFSSMTNAQATSFGTFLGNRYANTTTYPGIVWMEGNDYDGDGGGAGNVSGFVTQYQNLWNAISATGDTRPRTIEQGLEESLSTDGATLGPMATLNCAYSYHPTYENILRGRAAKTIPVYHFEGAYENSTVGAPATALDIRKEALWTQTSGGCGNFYGNDSLWFWPANWQTLLNTTMVAQRKAFMAVIAQYKWWTLAPDTGNLLVTAGRNTQWTTGSSPAPPNASSLTPATNDATFGHYVTAAFSADGHLAMIYNPNGSTLTLSSSHLATASPPILRVDPTSGTTTSLAWTTSLVSPGNNAAGDPDWLYIIAA